MFKNTIQKQNGAIFRLLFLFIIFGFSQLGNTVLAQENEVLYKSFKGQIIDSKTRKPLEFASVSVNGTNIAVITNTDGGFQLKVPESEMDNDITISYLGYYNKVIPLKDLKEEKNLIRLDESIVKLPEVDITSKNANNLIRNVIKNRKRNYPTEPLLMTAFYRETIKKGKKRYASLSEAVVEIFKEPYNSINNDYVKLYKARKSTDYRRLDTLLIKLQGGPYNALNFDLMKNQDILFNDDIFNTYSFTFDKKVLVDNRPTFVVDFRQHMSIKDPLFYGKLYIDASTYALTKAVISLNLEDKETASKYFVKKKPARAKVYPVLANYYIDFRQKNGKWYFAYGRIELGFKINYEKKLFNSFYYLTVEMAVTDWKVNSENLHLRPKDRLKRNIILNDKASGFSDPEFWGDYNVIEPEKSIENAIKKIKKHLDQLD